MGKLVSPYPPPDFDVDFILDFMPNACWWRHGMIDLNEDGNYAVWEMNDEQGWITIEWFDGLNTILDLGMDKPNVCAMAVVCVEPINYIDVLAEVRPSESFYRITEFGKIKHPGMKVCRDLDRV